MEENNVFDNQNKQKKKGMGPIKGLIVALILAICILAIGLLIRMLIADDGDFFKPIKNIFGIEEKNEEEDTKEDDAKKSSKKISSNRKNENLSNRYVYLSNKVEDKEVKHYRLTVDMGNFIEKFMEEFDEDKIDEMFNEKEDVSTDSNNLNTLIQTYISLLQQLSDLIDGEMYFDIYFEENEIVQIILGYDYNKLLENIYEYVKKLDSDGMKEEGINNLEDFVKYVKDQIEDSINEEVICDMILDSNEEVKDTLSEYGIKEKDIKDAIDINIDNGLIELYINGTTKLKAIISMALDSKEFQDNIKQIEKDSKIKIDEDNIIESILKSINDIDEYEDFGLKFEKVK